MHAVELVVIGPIARDTTMYVERLPDAGGSEVARELRVAAGGKGGSPAVVAASLGVRPRLLGAVGRDSTGDVVLAELAGAGVDVAAVIRVPRAATAEIVHIVEPGGRRRYLEWRGANGEIELSQEQVSAACAPGATVLLSTALPAAAVTVAASAARGVGARLVIDAAGEPELSRAVLPHADIVRADAEETAALVEQPVTDWESATLAAHELLRRGPRMAIVQAPGAGDVLARADREIRLPLLDVPLVDPTGAGDALITTLSVELARGTPLERAAQLASEAAARAAARLGAHA